MVLILARGLGIQAICDLFAALALTTPLQSDPARLTYSHFSKAFLPTLDLRRLGFLPSARPLQAELKIATLVLELVGISSAKNNRSVLDAIIYFMILCTWPALHCSYLCYVL